LDTILAEHERQFSAAQEKRLEDATAGQKTLSDQFALRADSVLNDAQDRIATFDRIVGELTREATDLQSKANQLLGFTGAASVAKAFIDEAESQRKEADRWRLIGLFVFALFGVGAFVAFALFPPDPSFDSLDFVRYAFIRLPVFLALAPAVRWLIGQANEHRQRERAARIRGQELSAFRPFVAELDQDGLYDAIEAASIRYFRGDWTADSPSGLPKRRRRERGVTGAQAESGDQLSAVRPE